MGEGQTGSLTVDYIYIGSEDGVPTQKNLYFEFTNDDWSRDRYDSRTYSFYQFDEYNGVSAIQHETYHDTHWTTSRTDSATDFSMDNQGIGTLTVNVAAGANGNSAGANGTNYGPWIVPTETCGQAEAEWYDMPLRYIPNEAEFVQVRFKLDGCEYIEGSTYKGTFVAFEYHYQDENGATAYKWFGSDHAYSFEDAGDGYVIVTMPTTEHFRSQEMIYRVSLRFNGIKSTAANNGTVTVDYIYVGTELSLPNQPLYFKFTDTAEDQTRYETRTYRDTDFDDAKEENWYLRETLSDITINNSGIGTMSLLVNSGYPTDSDSVKTGYHATFTGAENYNSSLYYHPGKNDWYQIRLKIENADAYDVDLNRLRVGLYYSVDGNEPIHTGA